MKGKKIISAALAGVMALSLTACGGGSTQETTAAPAADSKAEETTAAAEGSEAATGEGVAKEDLKVGELFAFLGSDESSYLTGSQIVIDGGSTLPETMSIGTN